VLDGEIVAFDADGRPSFERLQQRMHLTGEAQIRRRAQDYPVVYVIFDLLYLDGHSLMGLPYTERRARLEQLALDGPAWRTPAHHVGGGAALLDASAKQGLEGIMAKRLDCPYEPGKRAHHWVKVKTKQRQELVIGGWLPGEGRRSGEIGALLMGYYEDGEFRFAGKVGTGFGQKELDMLKRELAPLARDTSPFVGKQPQKGARFAEPHLVAEIEFGEWTKERILRHPAYKGLRDDKPAEQVVREVAGEPPPPEPPRTVRRTNVDKVLYPATGFTKGELISYYERMGEVILPHLHERLVSVKRYPNGVEGKKWWEREHRIDDLPALLEFANKAAIELHPHLSIVDRPTFVVFDLDPGPPAGIELCCKVALALRGMFSQLGLESFAKTSGGKGMQVYVPLNTEVTYEQTKPFAKAVAETMENGMPEDVVSRQAKKLREGKVLVDWGQNDPAKSMVCAYSLRGKERPTVSMPVAWEELEEPSKLGFEWKDALERVEREGDLFAPVLTLTQELPTAS
jgi:bifunctional non-homologous end joining protein LigD